MYQAKNLSWIGLLAFALCASVVAFGNPAVDDDDIDYFENRRVARITVTRGDVQIRRAGETEWEEAAPNVPLLEGDRIATGENSRLEVQFNDRNYLRVDENSLLKIVTLREEGVAMSLPEGSLSLRLSEINKDREYFEIDAPNTTVSARKEGLYRVDAPRERDEREVRVSVTGGGEARVYTENSGFTIRNGRLARVFLDGDYAGEFEMTAARSFSDDFDRWTGEREDYIARRRNNSRSYYDPSIYGAAELEEYGDWIFTDDYGYVWRPYRTTISSYGNWSPYRYGHWRHLPGFGWTWIADEPWGWATSHYGRWVYVGGGWVWSPYDSWRRRAYWQPALVIFANVGRNVCWYPMPYHYGYRHRRDRSRTIIYNNTTVVVNQKVKPVYQVNEIHSKPKAWMQTYAGAVSGVPLEEFGKGKRMIRPVGLETAKKAVETPPIVVDSQLPSPRVGKSEILIAKEREIVSKKETFVKAERDIETGRIGVMRREAGAPLDTKLRDERILRGRSPIERVDQPTEKIERGERPRTGVFDRKTDAPIFRPENKGETGTDRPTPRTRPEPKSERENDSPPIFRPEKRDDNPPVYRPEPRPSKRDDNENRRPPKSERQPEPERPRYEPPPQREERRYEPPPQREEPRYEPPKQRDEPRPEPPPSKREDPPPAPPVKVDKPDKDG